MKHKMILIGAVLLMIGFIMGRLTIPISGNDVGYIPPMCVIGDVENCDVYKGLDDLSGRQDIVHQGKRISAAKLKGIIDRAKPVSDQYDIVLIGEDGLLASIPGTMLEDCYIALTEDNGWEAVNDNHPISSNIKRIKEILVVSKENTWEYGLNIISQDQNLANITPGQMYQKTIKLNPNFEGKSSVKKGRHTYETSVYTMRRIFQLKDVIENVMIEKILLMGQGGDYLYDDGNGHFELKDNSFNYYCADGKYSIQNVVGALIKPPAETVMDTYYDTLHYMNQGEKVMILYLDGFGYHQYKHATENGYAPFIKGLPKAKIANTVFQSVTNAGFAAMITGKSPLENGIYSRKQKSLKVPSFFETLKTLNKTALLIEGNIGIINTEVAPILCVDKNEDGTIDDEIFETAVEKIGKDVDLLLVHFHSIDDSGHTYGDLSPKTLQRIQVIDGYIEKLMSNWTGKVIITTDHGMHANQEGGGHGNFRCEDMIIPYILTQGEGQQ